MTTDFVNEFGAVAQRVYQNSIDKGFWEGDQNDGEKIALIHSELSEALEVLRNKDPFVRSEKIPAFLHIEEELADAVIRIMDFSAHHNFQTGGAIIEKMAFNATRIPKHGRRF